MQTIALSEGFSKEGENRHCLVVVMTTQVERVKQIWLQGYKN